jgi:pimeloyl-ACP methyl ester carboxylesterase
MKRPVESSLCTRSYCVRVTIGTSDDGVAIAYDTYGTGATTLVFVHGWACDSTFWRLQVEAFAPDYRVITLDLAGHGRSGSGRMEWTAAHFASDVAAVLRSADASNVILIGHSLGGPIVLEAALLAPERVIGIVGVDTFLDAWLPAASG